MKILISFIFFLSMVIAKPALSQKESSCKVLVPELSGNYEGGCKKGLANGTGKAVGVDTYEGEFKKGFPNGIGTYTWANGDVYKGEFQKGKPDGEGVLTKKNGEVEKGYWKYGYYTGEEKNAPLYKVNRKQYVSNYSIQRVGDGEKVNFVWQWGTRTLYTADGLQMNASSGVQTLQSNACGYGNITFPFNAHVEFDASDKAGTFSYHCIFDFELLVPGSYIVKFNF